MLIYSCCIKNRSKLSADEQIISLKNTEGRVVLAEKGTYEEMNAKFQSVFTVDDTSLPTE